MMRMRKARSAGLVMGQYFDITDIVCCIAWSLCQGRKRTSFLALSIINNIYVLYFASSAANNTVFIQ